MTETITIAILVASGLAVASIFTSVISFRIGAPLLLVFLALGLLAGEDGLLGIDFDDAPTAYLIGSAALAIILFDSGYDTSLHSYRSAAWPAITLATAGVLLTAGVVAVPAHFLLGLDWLEGLLLGAIVSSTDAAAVFFLLRVGGIHLRDRVRSTLEIESGTNDPMAIFLTLALVGMLAGGGDAVGFGALALSFALQMGIGGAAGALGGWLIVQAVNRVELERGLYPLVVLGLALVVFSITTLAGGSGFLAVYVAGLIAGNARLRVGQTIRRFQTGTTWLAQITMFLTLGLLATPSQFMAVALPALAVALVLIFVARPLAVWLCLLPYGFSRNETTFVAWVGLRGAVSILLAIIPLLSLLPHSAVYFNTAFVVVLASLIVQGWTIGRTARWLKLVMPPRVGPVERVELELPGQAHHELVTYRINPESPVAKGDRIPRWARPSLVVREGRSLSVHKAGRLQPGDYVYLFVPPEQVPLLDRLFASPAALEEDDSEFFGDFVIDPEARLGGIAATYGFAVAETDVERTVAELLRREFGATIEAGDRMPLGPVELIVRAVDEDHRVTEVGLAVEPQPIRRQRLPIFQNYKEIAAAFRDWRARRRAPRTGGG